MALAFVVIVKLGAECRLHSYKQHTVSCTVKVYYHNGDPAVLL